MPRGDIVIGHPGTLSVTFVDMHAWLRQYLIEPSAALVQSMAVGEDLRDLEPCRTICTGIEGLFRDQVEQQYAAWPRGSTTDGFTADVCIRAAERTIMVVGMCWLDFTGRQFPLRATIELDADEKQLSTFTAEIGETDQRTGAPPLLRAGSMLLPDRDDDGNLRDVELLVGRRPTPIRWTTAFTFLGGDPEGPAPLSIA